MLSTWRILAAATGGWWIIWAERGSPSAATGHEISCRAWAYGRLTRNPAQRSQGILRSAFQLGCSQPYHGCGSGVVHRHHLHYTIEKFPLYGGDRESLLQASAQL